MCRQPPTPKKTQLIPMSYLHLALNHSISIWNLFFAPFRRRVLIQKEKWQECGPGRHGDWLNSKTSIFIELLGFVGIAGIHEWRKTGGSLSRSQPDRMQLSLCLTYLLFIPCIVLTQTRFFSGVILSGIINRESGLGKCDQIPGSQGLAKVF